MRIFATRGGIAAALGVLLAPGPALPGTEIPESARGRALGVPAYLLDGPELTFRLPHLVASERPSLLVVRTSSSSAAAQGVIAPLGGGLRAGYFSTRNTRVFLSAEGYLPLQTLALAGAWRGWEAGALFGWGTLGRKARNEYIREDLESRSETRDDW